MPKLPKRLPYEFALLAALALSSCDGPQGTARFTNADRDRIGMLEADMRRVAIASSAAIDRVERIESRLDDIESKLNM
jgi:hypothetical protein